MRMILVEDDKFQAQAMKVAFEQENYTVVALVHNGGEAVEVITKEKPDFVVMDVVLPQMDGFKILKKLRETSAFRTMPIFLVTNRSTDEDEAFAKKLGANEYFIKSSIGLHDLVVACRALLKQNNA